MTIAVVTFMGVTFTNGRRTINIINNSVDGKMN